MSELLALAGLFAVAFITPGPNNLIIMDAAVRGGLRGALPLAAGIITGGLVLLLAAWTGIAAIIAMAPVLGRGIVLAGTLYLVWLGATLLRSPARNAANDGTLALPASFGGVMMFQFLNPKAWVLVLTVSALGSGSGDIAVAAALLAGISAACLAVWALAGSALSAWLNSDLRRTRFDRTMGALLIAMAALFFGQNWA